MLGLVLVRPAWLNEPLPANLQAYPRIAQLIQQHEVAQGRELFMQTEAIVQRRLPKSGKRATGFSHVGELPPARRRYKTVDLSLAFLL
jgi:hypothetical protein